MFLRKLCLFSFFSPFQVKTKVYDSEMSDLFFQNHIQNISSSTIFIQKVSLEPSEMYTVIELNILNQVGEYECTFGTRTFFCSQLKDASIYITFSSSRNFQRHLLLLEASRNGKIGYSMENKSGWNGNARDNWTFFFFFETIELERETPGYRNVRLSLETIPDTVILEEPFHSTCKIPNYSDRKLKLVLRMCDTDSIRWCDSSERYLGKLPPGSTLRFTLILLSLQLGPQTISDIQITDKLLKKCCVCDDLAKVCVIPPMVKMRSWRKFVVLCPPEHFTEKLFIVLLAAKWSTTSKYTGRLFSFSSFETMNILRIKHILI